MPSGVPRRLLAAPAFVGNFWRPLGRWTGVHTLVSFFRDSLGLLLLLTVDRGQEESNLRAPLAEMFSGPRSPCPACRDVIALVNWWKPTSPPPPPPPPPKKQKKREERSKTKNKSSDDIPNSMRCSSVQCYLEPIWAETPKLSAVGEQHVVFLSVPVKTIQKGVALKKTHPHVLFNRPCSSRDSVVAVVRGLPEGMEL